MSFSIVNLPPYLRLVLDQCGWLFVAAYWHSFGSYRASNLLLSMIIPGPKETNPDQTQHYVRVLVNELLRLWHKGQVLPTYRTTQGRLVRVILVGVFCDKPVAHKIGGFGLHTHTFFCTRNWITQGLKATIAAFTKGGKSSALIVIGCLLMHIHRFPDSHGCPSSEDDAQVSGVYYKKRL